MRRNLTLVALLTALALPAAAADDDREGLREGLGLIQEGTRLMLRGLAQEIDPMLRELQEMMGDLSAYHRPEILPNGDILIRRRTPRAPTPDTPPPGDDTEL